LYCCGRDSGRPEIFFLGGGGLEGSKLEGIICKTNIWGTWQFGKSDVLVNFITQILKFLKIKKKKSSLTDLPKSEDGERGDL
jgi:hypothetical protein